MKNVKYLVFIFILLFVNIFYVHASCTDEEIDTLKKEVKNIKITYKHLGKVEIEGFEYYNKFELKVKNIPESIYILYLDETKKLVPSNGEIVSTIDSGKYSFSFFTDKCNKRIGNIEVHIPKFNIYSLNELCKDIDGDDFDLCAKYYEYDIDYTTFVEKVTKYRKNHNFVNDSNKESVFKKIISDIWDFIYKYNIYILILIALLIVGFLIFVFIRKNKKRGILE